MRIRIAAALFSSDWPDPLPWVPFVRDILLAHYSYRLPLAGLLQIAYY
jgi:hypothetical protein